MAVKNEGKVLETMDIVDPEAAFQAELLEEATQTLLHLSQCASSSPSLSRKGQGCIFLCTVKLDFKNRQDKNQLGFKNQITNDQVDQISFLDRQDKNILSLRTKMTVNKKVLKAKFDCI